MALHLQSFPIKKISYIYNFKNYKISYKINVKDKKFKHASDIIKSTLQKQDIKRSIEYKKLYLGHIATVLPTILKTV